MIETEIFTARAGGYRCYRIPGLVVSNAGTVGPHATTTGKISPCIE